MKFLVCFLTLSTLALTSAKVAKWENFKSQFGRQYDSSVEERHRMKVFLDNLRTIEAHNERFENGEVTFTMGVNQFADLTEKEFAKRMNSWKPVNKQQRGTKLHSSDCTLPDSIDWRSKGYVTPVKNEGQCGSATTYGSTGALEGANMAKTGTLTSLSEQDIQDCCPGFGPGCTGGVGTSDDAFQCVKDMGGIAAEGDFTGCASVAVAGTCSSYVDLDSGSEDDLKSAVGCVGTVAAAIDASNMSFQLYVSGVYYEPLCSSTELDHYVLVVGYGTDGGDDYWLVKNSWGTSWGEEGYVEMARNRDNNCGIATQASYPIA